MLLQILKWTLPLHCQTCFNSMWIMFCFVNTKSRTQCHMTITFSTCEAHELLTKTMLWIFLMWLFFLFKKTLVEGIWNKKINSTFLSIFWGNRWKKRKTWYRFMENLDKIMNPRKKIPNKQNLQDLELARGYA